ncbi:DUF1080 domain-containing protein [Alteromonas pelagimontana]|uniref:DUF1080 domain-containing protein n=1 Tax=Alteromonas pelagimontana TaxID=1858656 RepID=A0A6M4ME30_9ALTE|nr:DUF1080 domain-containing protein [Alteromonas pelagimontana]QJR81353.1 DUF1080 domain-containing protein [Alteromonas pelagimontana]
MKLNRPFTALMLGLAASTMTCSAMADDKLTPEQQAAKTEVWEPVPAMVKAPEGQAPSDAVILFDGKDLSAWEALEGGKAQWKVNGDSFTVEPGTGDIKSKQSFCDIQLHVEWKTPTDVEGLESQQRNNSGIFLQQRYEIQVLDSYNNKTYPNGQAGSVYKQTIPLVNASHPPGEWQTYDIIYNAPRFEGKKLQTPGYVTVLHNGVLVQNHTEIQGKTEWIGKPSYEAHGCAPLQLQDHGNKVSFRNIWVREIKPLD